MPDLLGIIPHLLGFHPDESLVVVVAEHGHVAVTARADLSQASPPGNVEGILARLWARFPAACGWFVAYSHDVEGAWEVLRRCCQALPAESVGAAVVVDGALWWQEPGARPSRLKPPESPDAVRAAFPGRAARMARAELAVSIHGPSGQSLKAAVAAVAKAEGGLVGVRDTGALMRALLARDPSTLGDAECAQLIALADDPQARDQAIIAPDDESADRLVALWSRVLRVCPPGHRAQPLALLGSAAWVAGEGALVTLCLEELERGDARVPLERVLAYLVDQVVPPSTWPQIREQLVDACAQEAA